MLTSSQGGGPSRAILGDLHALYASRHLRRSRRARRDDHCRYGICRRRRQRRYDRVWTGRRARRAGVGAWARHEDRPRCGLRRDQRQGRRARPQDQADQRERRLRAGPLDRRDQEADRGREGVRADRPGRHADLGRDAADRDRRQRAVHRRVHRRGLPAQHQVRERHQRARQLRRRDRSLGEAPHRGPEGLQDRDLLSGRRVRPRRPLRLQEGDGEAQDGGGRRGDLRAQHRRGEIRAADA